MQKGGTVDITSQEYILPGMEISDDPDVQEENKLAYLKLLHLAQQDSQPLPADLAE